METLGNDFTAAAFDCTRNNQDTKQTLLHGLIRASRVGLNWAKRSLGNLKASWDAAELRAAMIDQRIQKARWEQFPLYFGRHRIF